MARGSALDAELGVIVNTHRGICPPGASPRARSIVETLERSYGLVAVEAQKRVSRGRTGDLTYVDLVCRRGSSGKAVVVEVKYYGGTSDQYWLWARATPTGHPASFRPLSSPHRRHPNCPHNHYLDQLMTTMALYATTCRVRNGSTVDGLLLIAASDTTISVARKYHHTTDRQRRSFFGTVRQ